MSVGVLGRSAISCRSSSSVTARIAQPSLFSSSSRLSMRGYEVLGQRLARRRSLSITGALSDSAMIIAATRGRIEQIPGLAAQQVSSGGLRHGVDGM